MYMHEFNADREHAMCNIQNRSIPVVQLTQLQKLSITTFRAWGSQKLTVMLSASVQNGSMTMEVPG
jgi:hypothetical protein